MGLMVQQARLRELSKPTGLDSQPEAEQEAFFLGRSEENGTNTESILKMFQGE